GAEAREGLIQAGRPPSHPIASGATRGMELPILSAAFGLDPGGIRTARDRDWEVEWELSLRPTRLRGQRRTFGCGEGLQEGLLVWVPFRLRHADDRRLCRSRSLSRGNRPSTC